MKQQNIETKSVMSNNQLPERVGGRGDVHDDELPAYSSEPPQINFDVEALSNAIPNQDMHLPTYSLMGPTKDDESAYIETVTKIVGEVCSMTPVNIKVTPICIYCFANIFIDMKEAIQEMTSMNVENYLQMHMHTQRCLLVIMVCPDCMPDHEQMYKRTDLDTDATVVFREFMRIVNCSTDLPHTDGMEPINVLVVGVAPQPGLLTMADFSVGAEWNLTWDYYCKAQTCRDRGVSALMRTMRSVCELSEGYILMVCSMCRSYATGKILHKETMIYYVEKWSECERESCFFIICPECREKGWIHVNMEDMMSMTRDALRGFNKDTKILMNLNPYHYDDFYIIIPRNDYVITNVEKKSIEP
jgi:hypothetical protein